MTGRSSRLNLAAVYRPPASSSLAIPVGKFCSELDDVLGEILDLPGIPLVCGDFNCPGRGPTPIDTHLAELIETRDLIQRVDVPTHDCGNTLDLIVHLDGVPLLTTAPTAVDAGFSDHRLVLTDVFITRPTANSSTRYSVLTPVSTRLMTSTSTLFKCDVLLSER